MCEGPCVLPAAPYWHAPWPPYGWCQACWERQRRAAWRAYNQARRDGRLVPPTQCSACGRFTEKIVGHHTDYRHGLDVVWLCERDHARAHREQQRSLGAVSSESGEDDGR